MNPNTQLTQYPPAMSIPRCCRELLGISRALYYKLPPDERPPTIRIGSKPMIRTADALAWLESREVSR